MQKKDNYFKSLYSVIFDMMAEDNAKSLVIMLTTRFTVIKMSKMGHIFVFSAQDSQKSVIIWAKNLSASERSQLSLL